MNDNQTEKLKLLLCGIRHSSKLSKNQFSKLTGIPTTTLSFIENKGKIPSILMLSRYANYLQCNVSDLLQAVETNNQFSYLIELGKDSKATQQKSRKINIFNVFNALSDEDKKLFLEEAISQI